MLNYDDWKELNDLLESDLKSMSRDIQTDLFTFLHHHDENGKLIPKHHPKNLAEKVIVELPPTQKKFLCDAITHNLEILSSDLECGNMDCRFKDFLSYDLEVLKALTKYKMVIEMTETEKENFSAENCVDFPNYSAPDQINKSKQEINDMALNKNDTQKERSEKNELMLSAAFIKSKKHVRGFTDCGNIESCNAFVYFDSFHISILECVIDSYYLVLGNEDFLSRDLKELENRLLAFCFCDADVCNQYIYVPQSKKLNQENAFNYSNAVLLGLEPCDIIESYFVSCSAKHLNPVCDGCGDVLEDETNCKTVWGAVMCEGCADNEKNAIESRGEPYMTDSNGNIFIIPHVEGENDPCEQCHNPLDEKANDRGDVVCDECATENEKVDIEGINKQIKEIEKKEKLETFNEGIRNAMEDEKENHDELRYSLGEFIEEINTGGHCMHYIYKNKNLLIVDYSFMCGEIGIYKDMAHYEKHMDDCFEEQQENENLPIHIIDASSDGVVEIENEVQRVVNMLTGEKKTKKEKGNDMLIKQLVNEKENEDFQDYFVILEGEKERLVYIKTIHSAKGAEKKYITLAKHRHDTTGYRIDKKTWLKYDRREKHIEALHSFTCLHIDQIQAQINTGASKIKNLNKKRNELDEIKKERSK